MSSITVFGFFGVAAGRRVTSQKPGASSKTYHCFYSMALHCTTGASFPAELRVYSPFNDSVLPDNTVAFVIAKAHFPSTIPQENILLEASHVIPLPGDPSSDSYDNSMPDSPYPFICGLGSVPSRTETLADGVSKAFTVVSSDFVRDSMKASSVLCVYDGSRPRWSKTPTPNVNSTVQYFGQFGGAASGGGLRVNVDNIVLNVGHLDRSPSASTPSPAKKHKFTAFAHSVESECTVASGSSDKSGSSYNALTSAAAPIASVDISVGHVGVSCITNPPLSQVVGADISAVSPVPATPVNPPTPASAQATSLPSASSLSPAELMAFYVASTTATTPTPPAPLPVPISSSPVPFPPSYAVHLPPQPTEVGHQVLGSNPLPGHGSVLPSVSTPSMSLDDTPSLDTIGKKARGKRKA